MERRRAGFMVVVGCVLAMTAVSVASAGSSPAKQRIAIEGKFNILTGRSTWKLIPLSKGELTPDAGHGTGTGSSGSVVIRNGQSITPIVGGDTLTSKRGVIAVKETVRSHPAGLSFTADTGAWSLSGLNGEYAGYAGGGGFAAVGTPEGIVIFRMEGYVSKR